MVRVNEKEKADLEKKLSEKREALRSFYFGIAGSKIKNVKEAAHLRKEIARILGRMNEK